MRAMGRERGKKEKKFESLLVMIGMETTNNNSMSVRTYNSKRRDFDQLDEQWRDREKKF
jgi:hypothetical protein